MKKKLLVSIAFAALFSGLLHAECKEFIEAVKLKDTGTIKKMIAKAKIDCTDETGKTALHHAAIEGHDEIVNLLIKQSKNPQKLVNMLDIDGGTALHFAAARLGANIRFFLETKDQKNKDKISKYTKICFSLINNGADRSAKNKQGSTAYDLAEMTAQGKKKSIWAFLSPYAPDCEDIFNAIKENDKNELKRMVKKNPELVNCQDQNGKNPLHYAAENGYTDAALLLLQNKANVSATDILGRTPLHYAAKNGHSKIVMMFIEPKKYKIIIKDVKELINTKDKNGNTALHFAATKLGQNFSLTDESTKYKTFETICASLIKKGADKSAKNKAGLSAYDLANLASGKKIQKFEDPRKLLDPQFKE